MDLSSWVSYTYIFISADKATVNTHRELSADKSSVFLLFASALSRERYSMQEEHPLRGAGKHTEDIRNWLTKLRNKALTYTNGSSTSMVRRKNMERRKGTYRHCYVQLEFDACRRITKLRGAARHLLVESCITPFVTKKTPKHLRSSSLTINRTLSTAWILNVHVRFVH